MSPDIVSFIVFGAFAHLTLSSALFFSAHTVWRHTTSNWIVANVFLFLFMLLLSIGKHFNSYEVIIGSFWFALACLFLMHGALQAPPLNRYHFVSHGAVITLIIIVLSLMDSQDWALTLVKLALAGYLTMPLISAIVISRKTPVFAIFTAALGAVIAVLEIVWVFFAKKSSIELLFQFPFLSIMLAFFWASPFLFLTTETQRLKRRQRAQALEESILNEQQYLRDQSKTENKKVVRSLLIDHVEHLIRQPLAAIRRHADALAGALQNNPEAVDLCLEQLQMESSRFESEINRLRSLFDFNAPDIEIDLVEEINRALNALRFAWSDRDIEVNTLDSSPPINHRTLPYSTSQIILSVCLYAERFLNLRSVSCELSSYDTGCLMTIRLCSDKPADQSAMQSLETLLTFQFDGQIHELWTEGCTTRIFIHLP
jgi:signal transduction histidine kinase